MARFYAGENSYLPYRCYDVCTVSEVFYLLRVLISTLLRQYKLYREAAKYVELAFQTASDLILFQ